MRSIAMLPIATILAIIEIDLLSVSIQVDSRKELEYVQTVILFSIIFTNTTKCVHASIFCLYARY